MATAKTKMITRALTHSFDVLDDVYIEAIKKSALNLFNSYMPEIEATDTTLDGTTIEVRQKTLLFWPGLGKLTFGELKAKKIVINILPLHRVGAAEGASGSRVFVSYFSFDDTQEHSNPFILKFQQVGAGGKDKLQEEYKNSEGLKKHVGGSGTFFAFPFFNDNIDSSISILWALFSSSNFVTGRPDHKIELKEDNLWKAFEKLDLRCLPNTEDRRTIDVVFDNLFKIFLPIHASQGGNRREESLFTEYEWYLRDHNTWIDDALSKVWAPKAEAKTRDFGREWVNPLYVLDKLSTHRGTLTFGSVHGDLHTKNIVFGPAKSIRIIDFGWSQENRHIAKDYILLESNLRFMILHSDVPYSDIEKLCENLVEVSETMPDYSCGYVQYIHEKLLVIRRSAFTFLDKDQVYDEYLIPLFLLSIGLQKFSKSFNNIISARLTILKLAELIQNKLSL